MNKIRLVLSLFLLAALLLAACAPAAPTEAPAAPTAENEAVEAAPEVAEPPAPEEPAEVPAVEEPMEAAPGGMQEVPREETVIFENIEGRVPIPDNMNPYISGQYLDWGMWQATQESLFYLNYETGELIPWQAESFSYDETGKVVTIKIREGVEWGDGEPFTANDVVFTINMLKDNPELSYSSDMTQWVEDITAPDDYTVVITLTAPNVRFVQAYFSVQIWDTLVIAAQHVWEDQDPTTFTNYDLDKGWPLGTGPYKLVRSTETETVFDLRDSWWAAKTGFHEAPAPKRAIWIAAGTEDLRAAMGVNDELDALWLFSRSSFEVAQSRNPNLVGWTNELPYAYLDPCPRFMGLNNAVAPFDDVDIRWAINYAINRDEVVTIAYEGMTEAAATLFPTYAPLQDLLDRNAALFEEYPVLETNLSMVDEIMTSKGYQKDDDGMWIDSSGAKITFTIITRSGESDKVKTGPILVEQLRTAGFDADFQPLESAVFYDDVFSGTASAWLTDLCGSVNDPYETFSRFHSRRSAPIGKLADGSDGACRFENAEYDALVDQLAAMPLDDPEYGAVADQILGIWVKESPVISLVQARLLTPFNNTYWTNWPTAENNYIHPGHWWYTGNQLLINIKPAGE